MMPCHPKKWLDYFYSNFHEICPQSIWPYFGFPTSILRTLGKNNLNIGIMYSEHINCWLDSSHDFTDFSTKRKTNKTKLQQNDTISFKMFQQIICERLEDMV